MKLETTIDSPTASGILKVQEVARYLGKSESWVYKNSQILGGVKLGGSLFFPSKGELNERIFHKGQRVASGLRTEQDTPHQPVVQDKNLGQASRNRQKKGVKTGASKHRSDPARHGLFAVGEQKT